MGKRRKKPSKNMLTEAAVEQAGETTAEGSGDGSLKETKRSPLLRALRLLLECLFVLALIAALILFAATPWKVIAKLDCSAELRCRILMSDPVIRENGYGDLTQYVDLKRRLRSSGIKIIGQPHMSVSPSFLVYTFGYWGNFREPSHQVVENLAIERSINWERARIEACLGLLVGLFPLFKLPAKLMRHYLDARG